MKRLAVLLLVAALGACATTSDTAAPDVATDSDEFAIRATVLAVYNVVSGPAGRRDWDRFEELFAPGARIVVVSDAAPLSMTAKEYADREKPRLNETSWFQRPVATRVLRYGNLAHVWSTYSVSDKPNAYTPNGRGIISVALVRIGNEWKVQSLVSEAEDAAHPIPSEFAPR
jgi:hypothetical protein